MQGRRFSGSDRQALFIASSGRCSLCGTDLTSGWHADHVQPYSKGGPTDVINGQALCPACNRMKGDRMVVDTEASVPTTSELRTWQKEALRAMIAHGGDTFFLEAYPGAGKTRFALTVAQQMFSEGRIDRVVVVCPTENLKEQWGKAAAQDAGIQLDWRFNNADGREAPDFDGIVTTYQAVGKNAKLHRVVCAQSRTLSVFDEIHHAGEQKVWGAGLLSGFERAAFRLALSGTPFRSDNVPIPFVRYEHGRSKPDFRFGYDDCLSDGICRHVVFPSYEGIIQWMSGFDHVTAKFSDPLDEQRARERLVTALDLAGEWLPTVIRDFWSRLREIRESEQPDAAGLIIANTQEHARAIGVLVQRITGYAPTVAVSDDPDASALISSFKGSSDPVIIAVRMVSEGVDIPRLRACVYATNILTDLFFIQAVGRILRGPTEELAYFFLPADPVLLSLAQSIKEQRDHQIKEEIEAEERDLERTAKAAQLAFRQTISSEAVEHDTVYNDERFAAEEIAAARLKKLQAGIPGHIPDVFFAQYERIHGRPERVVEVRRPEASTASVSGMTLTDKKRALRKMHQRLVNIYSAVTEQPQSIIHTTLTDWMSASEPGHPVDVKHCTEDQLMTRIKKLEEWLNAANDGNPIFA